MFPVAKRHQDISQPRSGWKIVVSRHVLKGRWKRCVFPMSFQGIASSRHFQPLRGWLISTVASRQQDGFNRAYSPRGLFVDPVLIGAQQAY